MKNKNLIIRSIITLILIIVISILLVVLNNETIVVNDENSTTQGINQVVNANNKFAFDFYKNINNQNDNVFFSPYSISSALIMTYEGARGNTANEMQDVFYLPKKEILRPNFAAIYNEINKGNKKYELNTANALWTQENYPFLVDYINVVENYYDGKATDLNFGDPKSKDVINDYIADKTNNKITNLIKELSPATRLVLTNAVYFKGNWQWEFDKSKTRDDNFYVTNDNAIKVPMMNMKNDKARFNYFEDEKLQMLELPYKDDEVSMIIFLPKNNLAELENNLTFENYNKYKNKMYEKSLDTIKIPKFEFKTDYNLNQNLIELGMPSAFNEKADFSAMTGARNLFISQVLHQAYIKVDEKGTEAAAATAVLMKETAMSMNNDFIADHPFIFIIQQKETENILFMGKVIDPTL